MIMSLKVSQACYKKLWHKMVTENMMLDQNLLRPGYVDRVDGPLEEKPPPLSDDEMASFVQTCIDNPSEVDNNHLQSMLLDMGLNLEGCVTKKTSVEKCLKG